MANVCVTVATETAERVAAAAWTLAASAPPGRTLHADKGYDTARFVDEVRALEVTPHIALKIRYSAIDGRTTRHPGYQISQRKRKLVQQVFGWLKTVGGLRKLRHRDGAARRLDRDLRGGRLQPRANADLRGDVSLTAWVNGG